MQAASVFFNAPYHQTQRHPFKMNNKPLTRPDKQSKTARSSGSNRFARLSDTELEKHLRVFLKNIINYHHLFP